MKRQIYAGFVILGFAATPTYASDFSITGNLSQTLSGSDNFFLNSNPRGPTYDSISALSLNALARTATTEYHLDGHFSYFNYFGPGAADTTVTSGKPMGAHFYIDHRSDSLTRWTIGTSWERVDVASTQFAQTGQAAGTGFSDTYTANVGVTRDLSRLDTLSLSATASSVSFSAPGQTPYDDLNTSASWKHRLSPLLIWNNSVSLDLFQNKDAAKTQRITTRATTALEATLTPRLSAHASFGWIFANSYTTADVSVPLPPPGTVLPSLFPTGSGDGPLLDVGVNYQFTKTLSGALSVSEAVTPTILGQLQQSKSIQGGLTQQVNGHSTVSFTSQYSRLFDGVSNSNFFTAGLGYTYRFTKDIRGTASYTFVTRADQTGDARSNTFLLSLSKDFVALP